MTPPNDIAPGVARRWAQVVIVAGIGCALLDRLHMESGAIGYPTGEQPWWVPLELALATLAMVSGVAPIRRLFRGVPEVPPRGVRILADALAFAGAWTATCFLQDRPDVALALLVAWWLSRALPRPLWTTPFSLVCAGAGLLVEALLIWAGVFTHTQPDVLGVARWLPAIYLHAGLLAASLASWIEAPRVAARPQLTTSSCSALVGRLSPPTTP